MFTDFAISDYSLEPESNLDVPFVPTDEKVVEAMLELGGVGSKDLLYDLGCGDGRIAVAAAKDRGARAVGIDIDPLRIEESREYAEWVGVDHMVEFVEDDLLCADFSKATVVTLYLLHTVNLELRPHLLSGLQPGTRVISHAFDMGAWKADEQLSAGGAKIFKWIIPAKVEGAWEWKSTDGKHYRVELEQEFQKVSGKAWVDGNAAELETATLRGARLELGIRENGETTLETFDMRCANNQLLPTVASKQATTGVMVPLVA